MVAYKRCLLPDLHFYHSGTAKMLSRFGYFNTKSIANFANFNRGHRELLDGRLCRPDSKQWP